MTLTSITELVDAEARRRAAAWFDRFDVAFPGGREAAASARATLETHLIEALDDDPAADLQTVEAALKRLGAPEDLAADWGGHDPAAAPEPASVARRALGVALRLTRSVGIALSLVLLLGALVRLVDPGSVGLFQLEDGTLLAGTRNERPVAADLLGPWTAPVFALAGAGFMAASLGGVRVVKVWLSARRR
jgi:hypothetical protein